MSPKSLSCPICGKSGFRAKGPLNSHVKALHPGYTLQNTPEGQNTYKATYEIPMMDQGFHEVNCPACRRPTVAYYKEDGTMANSSKEIPKPPSSSEGSRQLSPLRRNAHPVVIKERYKMRWNNEENRWKNTVAMMGTHGKTAPEMPWYELGISERWLLNDSHGIPFVEPHVEEGKVDRWWQIHHRWRTTRRHTRHASDHWQWLQDVQTVPRIVMQRHYKEVPNSEGFPIREICEMFLGDKLGRGAGHVQYYFTNTFSYMFAQLLYEKVKGIKDWERVELYGCELEQLETEYFRQRPGIEFWMGMCVAYGIEVYVPEPCFMLYAQDVVQTPRGQAMLQYPGYMAYGYKSPSLEEAKAQKQPIGVDPIEENVIGAWDDYVATDHTYALNEAFAKMVKRNDVSEFKKEMEVLNEWLGQAAAEPQAAKPSQTGN